MPRTPFDKFPASGVERGIGTSNSPSTIKASAIQPLGLFAFGLNGSLTINTPQDVSHYDSKQTSYGVGVSIPIAGGFSVSANYSNDKVNANTTTTKEIAGIYAGEGGYDIQVKGNTTLDAGVIASTASSANNQLTTSTLVLKDKANQSAYDADSVGLSASYTSDSSKGLNGWNASPPSAMGASDDASSTSRAAISAGNIRITNDAAQQQLTGQTAEQTLAGLNHDTANNATLANLYEQDKESIQTGFAIGRGLSQNFATFMNYMAQDMDSVANAPAVDKNGNPIEKDGKRLTNQEAYQAGFELGDTINEAGESINYGTRQDLWGSGGTGNRIATALIGAYSGNVSNGASTLLQNAAINVVRSYGATEIKHLADGFSTETDEKGNPIPNGTSETVRGLLHAIAGCAGASATGGDCASAGLASAGTVAMNNAMTALLNLNPNDMTDTQKQAYSNLMGTLVAGVSTAVGGDAAAAQLASRTEVEDNWLNAPDAAEKRRLELRMGQSPSEAEIKRLAVLINRDLKNNKDYAVACKDKNSNTCKQYVATKINSAIATYYGGGANEFNKDEYREIVNIQYRVTQAWSAADRQQNQAITQNMTNAVAAMNDPANKAEAERLYQLESANQQVLSDLGYANGGYGANNMLMANEAAGLTPKPIDYISINGNFYIISGGAALNTHNGKWHGQWSLGRSYPAYSIKPGVSIVTGDIINSNDAKETDDFLDGAGYSASGFTPFFIGGGINKSIGGKFSTEFGLGTPGVGISPFGYGWTPAANDDKKNEGNIDGK